MGAEGEDVFPGVAGVGREMGVVSGLDEAVEHVDDIHLTTQMPRSEWNGMIHILDMYQRSGGKTGLIAAGG